MTKRNMSDLDLQVEHGRATLPAGHCSDEQQHTPHLMRAANTVATHYCDGAPLAYRGGLSEHYIRLFCRNVVADNDAYMAEEISHDEFWARVHERDAQVAKLSADDRFYLNMLSAKDVAAGGQLPPVPVTFELGQVVRNKGTRTTMVVTTGGVWTSRFYELVAERSCHRTREHVPHVEYGDPGAPFPCPGVGNFAQVVTPPADPFAGIE